jgi:DNA-binding transcriptional MerR regulator
VDGDLMNIGTFALLSGLSVPTLRHYDEIGLLEPAEVDARTGYRRYRRGQLERAGTIRALRSVDLPLEDVRRVLEGDDLEARSVLEAHRDRLVVQSHAFDQMVEVIEGYLKEGFCMQAQAVGVRFAALNLGVKSQAELETAQAFWGSVFGAELEDWGLGSQQMRVGPDDQFFMFNIRVRSEDEPHYGHAAAFGLAVDDLDAFHRRALDAGAKEHYPPTDSDVMPRHSRFEDPVGNRVVVFQQ